MAIETTYSTLAESFEDDDWIGLVQYVDYEMFDDSKRNDSNMMMFKRKEFEFEGEVRVVRRHIQFAKSAGEKPPASTLGGFITIDWFEFLYDQPKGLLHPINLNALIKRVLVSPYAKLDGSKLGSEKIDKLVNERMKDLRSSRISHFFENWMMNIGLLICIGIAIAVIRTCDVFK